MAAKKIITLQVITHPDCEGSTTEAMLYDPVKKEIISSDLSGMARVERVPIAQRLSDLLSGKEYGHRYSSVNTGSADKRFKQYMLIQDFKKMYEMLIKDQKPTFKTGDIVWHQNEQISRSDGITYYKVGEVLGWYLPDGCDIKTGERPPLLAVRSMVNTETGKEITDTENKYKPIEELEEWKEGREAVNIARRSLKKAKIFGGTIYWSGRAYRF